MIGTLNRLALNMSPSSYNFIRIWTIVNARNKQTSTCLSGDIEFNYFYLHILKICTYLIIRIFNFWFSGLWRKMVKTGRVANRKLPIYLPPLMKFWIHTTGNYALTLVVSRSNPHSTPLHSRPHHSITLHYTELQSTKL